VKGFENLEEIIGSNLNAKNAARSKKPFYSFDLEL